MLTKLNKCNTIISHYIKENKMPKWTVTLRDPLYKKGRLRDLYTDVIEADTEYGAKKAFFDNLLTSHPEVPKAPFSTVLPHIRIKKVESLKPKASEFPPENFFRVLKRKLKGTSVEEELETSSLLPKLVNLITEESLEKGTIPQECPICRRPTKTLYIHHWNGDKSSSLMRGYYRRMCSSCNSSLGQVFKGTYPPIWKLQYEGLLLYFKKFPKTYSNAKEEGWWSLLNEKEWNRIKAIWDNTPRKILYKGLESPTNRKNFRKDTV